MNRNHSWNCLGFHIYLATWKTWICWKNYTLGEIVIPYLLLVCFDDAMHGIYASFFVDMRFRVKETNNMNKRHGMTISPRVIMRSYLNFLKTCSSQPKATVVFMRNLRQYFFFPFIMELLTCIDLDSYFWENVSFDSIISIPLLKKLFWLSRGTQSYSWTHIVMNWPFHP